MKKGTKFVLIAAGLILLGYSAVPFELYFGSPAPQKLRLPETLPEPISAETVTAFAYYTEVDGIVMLEDFGELLPFKIRRPKQAQLAIAAFSEVLGIADVRNDLRYAPLPRTLSTTAFGTVGHYYIFEQYYEDIPVDGGSILLFADNKNLLTELYSTYVRDISLETTEPKLTAEEAERIAAKHELNETSREHETELVVASDAERGAVLAWRVYFDTLLSDAVCVDACTGEIVVGEQTDSTESES